LSIKMHRNLILDEKYTAEDMAGLCDTHAHLSQLADDEDEERKLLAEAAGAGFSFLLDIGTDAGDLSGRWKLLSRSEQVYFAAGSWPYQRAAADPAGTLARLEESIALAGAPARQRLVAIGECGFDRRENPDEPAGEEELLEGHCALAKRLGLPIIIHSREACRRTQETLARYPEVPGVIHCFSYTAADAKIFLDMGYYISFAGNLTFKNAPALREAIRVVPDDRLLLETDSPFLSPAPYRGRKCRPERVLETYRVAALLRETDLASLKRLITKNARALFLSGRA
jgi:TatD DNase family protein